MTSEDDRLWGPQTERAVANVGHIAGPLPPDLIAAIVAIKIEAAAVNARHGVIPTDIADAIRTAGDLVLAGDLAGQFPVDVFQTGSGTSSNMNVNEVLSRLASDRAATPVHPNDHVNASQSSNDVFPSAIRIAALLRVRRTLVPALEHLHTRLAELAAAHADTVKLGRTHLMDAVPMTFGQEVGGWARAVELTLPLIAAADARLHELALGGTAVGTGLNAPQGFGGEVAAALGDRFGLRFREAVDHFESQGGQEALGALSGACRTVALTLNKIAGDVRLLGSGPASGLGRGGRARPAGGELDHAGQGEPRDHGGRAADRRPSRRQRRGDHVRVDERNAAADDRDAGDGAQPARQHRTVRTRRDAARRQGHRPARSELGAHA